MKKMKKDDFDINFILDNFFGITEKEINDLIFKLKNEKELNFSDNLLINQIKLLNLIIDRRKK